VSERHRREELAAKIDADGDPKLKAAAEFAVRLPNSPVGGREMGQRLSKNLDRRHKARYDGQSKIAEDDAHGRSLLRRRCWPFLTINFW